MKSSLFTGTGLAAFLSCTAFAQDAPTPPRPLIGGHGDNVEAFIAQYDDNHDGRVTWDEFSGERRKRFDITDANHDGTVSEDEYVQEFKERSAQALKQERDAQVAQAHVRFRVLDTNKDGKASRAEFDASGERVFAEIEKTVNRASPAASGRKEGTESDGNRLGMPGSHSREGLLDMYDTNDDDKITRAEFDQTRAEQFKRTDSNGDGTLSESEYVGEFQDRMDRRLAVMEDDERQTHIRFGVLDADKDGKMTFEEYQVSGKRTFDSVDRNHDGVVDATDAKLPPPPRSQFFDGNRPQQAGN